MTRARRRVLVTGATGVVGSELMAVLRRRGDLAVRGTSARGAPDQGIVPWTMGRDSLPSELGQPWDVVFHTAASVKWSMTAEVARKANFLSTEALGEVAGPRTHVVHVSTAFVESSSGGIERIEVGEYRNAYEWSKAAAERWVLDRYPDATIVRPPLIIGRRADGRVARFIGLYTFIRGVTSGLAPAIIGDREGLIELAPVDDVVVAITGALDAPAESPVVLGRSAHAVSMGVLVDSVVATLNTWRARREIPPLETPPVIPRERWQRFFLPFAREHLSSLQLRAVELLSTFEPYLSTREPLAVTHYIAPLDDTLERSVEYWAEANPVSAARMPREWRAAGEGA